MTHDEQLELLMAQQREIQELRSRQLARDGRFFHADTRAWILADGTHEVAFAERDNNGR